MKIILFLGKLQTGGTERQFTILATELAKRGHTVHMLLLFGGDSAFSQQLKAVDGVLLESLFEKKSAHSIGVIKQLVQSVVLLRKKIQTLQPVVVYSALSVTNFVAWLATRFGFANKLVWGIRSCIIEQSLISKLAFHCCALVSGSVPLIISNSFAGRTFAQMHGYTGHNFEVLYNGIDTALFYPEPANTINGCRIEWQVSEGKYIIGIVARLDSLKDHPTFLKMAAELLKSRSDLHFVCIGGGPDHYLNKLQQQSRDLDIEHAITWTGEQQVMRVAYNTLDVLVSSSIAEGFSNAIIEALSCGTPCVVTDVGDSAKIVKGMHCKVARAQDFKQLADSCLQLLQTQKADYVKGMSETVKKSYCISGMTEKFLSMVHPYSKDPIYED